MHPTFHAHAQYSRHFPNAASRLISGPSTPASPMLEHLGFDLGALEESGVCGGGHTECDRRLWPCEYQS